MQIDNEDRISKAFFHLVSGNGFGRTTDPDTFQARESNDLVSLLALTREGNNYYRIDYGLRPDSSFKKLGSCLSSELPPFIPNPFLEKWSALIWLPVTPSIHGSAPIDEIERIAAFAERELSYLREMACRNPMSYWAELMWNSKKFDGMSRYELVYILLEQGRIDLARRAVEYFSLLQAPVDLQSYYNKISKIFDDLGHAFDRS